MPTALPISRLENPQAHPSVNIVSIITTSALTGALAGRLFSIISPTGGAVFGIASALTNLLVDEVMNAAGCRNPQNVAFKIAKTVIPLLVRAAVGGLVAAACGFPITFMASLMLTGAIFLTSMLVVTAITACCIGSCRLLGAAVGMPSRTV